MKNLQARMTSVYAGFYWSYYGFGYFAYEKSCGPCILCR